MSDPITEVYEKFKHLDKCLSDTEWCEAETALRFTALPARCGGRLRNPTSKGCSDNGNH